MKRFHFVAVAGRPSTTSVRRAAVRLIGLTAFSLLGIAALKPGPRMRIFGQEAGSSTPSPVVTVPDATHVLGLEGIKRGVKGRLAIKEDTVQFEAGTDKAAFSIASIQDVFTGEESKQLVGGKKGTAAKLALPYGGGRVVSLFASQKIDVLTVEYRDSNGGLHGAIFALPAGQAGAVKSRLVKLGAHASAPSEGPAKP